MSPRSTTHSGLTTFGINMFSRSKACANWHPEQSTTTSIMPTKNCAKHKAAARCWQCSQVWLTRSEEHTSELQSRENLVCRLLLEKKKMRLKNLLKSTEMKISIMRRIALRTKVMRVLTMSSLTSYTKPLQLSTQQQNA